MYNFSYFKDPDKQVIFDFIDENPFACMTGSFLSGKQVATQIPVLYEMRANELYLQGHIMRKTDHHQAFEENPNCLLVFTGPSCYVSASWYSHPQIGSTWNYMSVHLAGQIRFMNNRELEAFMRKLTLKFENGNSMSPTIFDNLPETFITKMMPMIVGFEIKVESMDHIFKLSQNRDKQSYLNIIHKLEEKCGQSALIATEMRKRYNKLFPDGLVWDPSRFES